MKRRALAFTVAVVLATSARAAEPGGRELDAALRAIVEGGPLAGARAGILVEDAESGEVLYAKDADVITWEFDCVKIERTLGN